MRGDASSVVDMEKLTWNVDGGGSTTFQMPVNAADSIILTDANTLTITLSEAAGLYMLWLALVELGHGWNCRCDRYCHWFITDTAAMKSILPSKSYCECRGCSCRHNCADHYRDRIFYLIAILLERVTLLPLQPQCLKISQLARE